MKRMFLPLTAAALAAIVLAAPSFSKRNSPAQLTEAGWACPVLLGAVHCLPPGSGFKSPASPSITALVFEGTDPTATEATFLGTEHVLRADVFEKGGRPPCPQDPPTYEYRDLRTTDLGIPYYACHHYDSSF
jgi:hypothetical protein